MYAKPAELQLSQRAVRIVRSSQNLSQYQACSTAVSIQALTFSTGVLYSSEETPDTEVLYEVGIKYLAPRNVEKGNCAASLSS